MSEGRSPEGVFRILILDDNRSTRALAKATLENHLSCSVTLCDSQTALFDQASKTPADLILLDVDLGSRSGIDVCRDLQAHPETKDTPVVFLSAYKEPARRVEALKAGGVDYLDKPFYPEELVVRVKSHAEKHRLRLENASQIAEQQALLRVLCHDLVNPIFGAHSLLTLKREKGNLDERTLDIIVDCCESAMEVISHVRDQHKLVSTNKQFATSMVSLREAFAESERVLSPKFEQKKVELKTRLQRDISLRINKVVLVHSVLNNLLTNALKFSHPGGVVSLSADARSADGEERCVIEVRDGGIGMPPDILAKVFDEDARVSRRGTASEEGTGFGMPLVKRYVEKSEGKVEIESVEEGSGAADSGTTVRLVFPLEQ